MNKLILNKKVYLIFSFWELLFFYFGNKLPLQKKILKKAYIWASFKNSKLSDFETYWNEIISNNLIPINEVNSKKAGNVLTSTFGKWIYIVVRSLKPNSIVETGVSHGYSSWIILNAIQKNGKGKLYSIDLPGHDTNSDYNLTETKIGQIVPLELKKHWELIFGDVKNELPELLRKLSEIDMFFHDSDHSYDNMKFEFNIAKVHLIDNGILLSDDIYKNNAFEEFVSENKFKTVYFTKGGMCKVKK